MMVVANCCTLIYFGYYRTLIGNSMQKLNPLLIVSVRTPEITETATEPSPATFQNHSPGQWRCEGVRMVQTAPGDTYPQG